MSKYLNQYAVSAHAILPKPANYYYDWVYMGKEAYGTKHWNRAAIKPGTKFFDALGKAYDKMKAKIKYYIFKDAIDRKEYETALEFDVYARIIKDSEGNDIQAFIKEDKRNGLRRDSSFYWDGSWEVFEFDDAANETRFRASSGIRSLRKYDGRKRLKELYRIDGNGDTLASEQYEWKNGRLVRMTANGVARNYIYGKTLQDTVRVVPSDEGFNYHRGYNGTAGKIPDEGDPWYEIFAMEPYGNAYFNGNENKTSIARFASKSSILTILKKDTYYSCTDAGIKERPDMPDAQCIRLTTERNTEYGKSYFDNYLLFECKCNTFGRYQPYFTGETIGEEIEVYMSFWKHIYNLSENYWQERCRRGADLQRTYDHETKHIQNARYKANNLAKMVLAITYDTKEKCEDYGYLEQTKQAEKWNEWSRNEREHKNTNPPSPIIGEDMYDYPCN